MNYHNLPSTAKIIGFVLVIIVIAFFGRLVYGAFNDVSINNKIMYNINICSISQSIHSDECTSLAKYGVDAKLVRTNDYYIDELSNALNDDTLSKVEAVQILSEITLEFITPPAASAGAAMIKKAQESAK